jgi:hypothetical protein
VGWVLFELSAYGPIAGERLRCVGTVVGLGRKRCTEPIW